MTPRLFLPKFWALIITSGNLLPAPNWILLRPPSVPFFRPAIPPRAKNSVIQIDFSKPIDPTGIQGEFKIADDGSSYYLTGQNIFATSSASSRAGRRVYFNQRLPHLGIWCPPAPAGQRLRNPIYRLPVCDKAGANCKKMIILFCFGAGKVQRVGSFEALPFSGVMDLSGNALDGNSDRKTQNATTTLPVFPTGKNRITFFGVLK